MFDFSSCGSVSGLCCKLGLRGLSPQEIALELGMSEGTVHVHGAKGVRRCEEFLRERGLVGRARA